MKRASVVLVGVAAVLFGGRAAWGEAEPTTLRVASLPGECWWGGATTFGTKEPFGGRTSAFAFDLRTSNYGNQAAPLLVSNRGRYIWSDKPFKCTFADGTFTLEGSAPFDLGSDGKTLREALKAAAAKHFPPSGKLPDLDLIAHPQWNTWVELTYNQNQKDILAYAKAIQANGFPAGGVIMVDDTWQYGYGIWKFEPQKFPDPKAMMDELHGLGYKVMLWVCTYVSMDSPGYRELAFGLSDQGRHVEKGGFMLKGPDDPVDAKWWNGKSAEIDYSHPNGCAWFARQLSRLQKDYGVDGFKLDAGDTDGYGADWIAYDKSFGPADQCEAYAKIGLQFPLNEYRACWKMAGQPLVQRLRDKDHSWEAIGQLVPDMIACGLLGHSFVCPDMIGSGSWMAFAPDAPHPYEPEIFVRSAQIHALAPMMQFSAAPWRMLKGDALDAVRAAAWTRMKFTPYILGVARKCAETGEPMLRSLEYMYPGHGWEMVDDQFLLGEWLMVAPQTKKGAASRKVVVPPGRWRADDGTLVQGPQTIEVATPLARLPYFVSEDFPSIHK